MLVLWCLRGGFVAVGYSTAVGCFCLVSVRAQSRGVVGIFWLGGGGVDRAALRAACLCLVREVLLSARSTRKSC